MEYCLAFWSDVQAFGKYETHSPNGSVLCFAADRIENPSLWYVFFVFTLAHITQIKCISKQNLPQLLFAYAYPHSDLPVIYIQLDPICTHFHSP